ncbi:MAG: hypothetical protein K0S08_683 [Gammaproteobacteria bacterium]|jgi:hypothetical protein|nr:hypothetical protein [Gammaproteobacteria bacterium]
MRFKDDATASLQKLALLAVTRPRLKAKNKKAETLKDKS